ncbi:MAG TPA: diguanylate cyclase, partial [Candidatus Limnocylindria bacterium]|nr:diguanylate cyclase [Candidatus Limnocylindria bacterium]
MGGKSVRAARSRLRMPVELLEKTRLLFLALMLGSGTVLLGQFVISDRPVVDRIGDASVVGVLLAVWIWTYRRRAYPRLVDPLVAAGLVLLAVSFGNVEPILGLFLSIMFRGLYGSTPQVAVTAVFYVAAMLAAYLLGGTTHALSGHEWLVSFVSLAPVVPAMAMVGRFLKRTIESETRLEEQMRRSEDRFRSLVHNSSDVIIILDARDRIEYHTPSTERLLGYAASELVGRPLALLLHPEDRTDVEAFLRSAVSVDAASMEWRLLHADGRWLYVEALSNGLLEAGAHAGLVLTMRNVTERRALETRLTHQAVHDALTDLPNRVLFNRRIAELLARTADGPGCVGVLFIDLDDFKLVNDTLGHAVGDHLIVAVAARISATLRAGDLAARLGGDEFAVLAMLRSSAESELLAARLTAAFEAPFDIAGNVLAVRASIGVATSGPDDDSPDAIMRNADMAMYSAKGHGKARFECYEADMGRTVRRRARIGGELAAALEHEQFVLHYQPIVALGTGETVGAEALVRWQHPTRGLVPPMEFIPAAEENGSIVPLGR